VFVERRVEKDKDRACRSVTVLLKGEGDRIPSSLDDCWMGRDPASRIEGC
jgi:hypothetical protein